MRGAAGRVSPEEQGKQTQTQGIFTEPPRPRSERSRERANGRIPGKSKRTRAPLYSLVLPQILLKTRRPLAVQGFGACVRMCFHPSL